MSYDTALLIGLENYADGIYNASDLNRSISSKLRSAQGSIIYDEDTFVLRNVNEIKTIDGRKRLVVKGDNSSCFFKVDDLSWNASTASIGKPIRVAMGMCIRFSKTPPDGSYTVCIHTKGTWSKIYYPFKPNVDYYIELLYHGPRETSKTGAYYINGKRISGTLGDGGGSTGQECYLGVNFTSTNNVPTPEFAYVSDLYISHSTEVGQSPRLGPITVDSIDCYVKQYKGVSLSPSGEVTSDTIAAIFNEPRNTTSITTPNVILDKSSSFVQVGFKSKTSGESYEAACVTTNCFSDEPSGNNLKISVNLNGGGGDPVTLEPGQTTEQLAGSYFTGKVISGSISDSEIDKGFHVSIQSVQGAV
ncbi:hypothetical protein [Proteus phage 10]|nr:hypothetical protein [Proteus phage 10]